MDQKRLLTLTVNGDVYDIVCAPNMTLLDALREKAILTGTKRGCDVGACGACTVLLDGEATLACLTLAVDAAGREITTVEGLAQDGELSPLQKDFMEYGAIQCGFCSPGFLMSATACWPRTPARVAPRSNASWRATSAAAPATSRSWRPSRPPWR